MRINEVTNNLNTYIATVHVVLQDGSTIAKTQVFADGFNQARAMLIRIYGVGNVLTLSQFTNEEVTEETKTLSSAELQVKSLADQSKRLNQQAKQLKVRQGLQKAQAAMVRTNNKFNLLDNRN
jgi:hypothetical protein